MKPSVAVIPDVSQAKKDIKKCIAKLCDADFRCLARALISVGDMEVLRAISEADE